MSEVSKDSIAVLIVDDNPQDRQFYRRALQKSLSHEYSIVEAETGEEALKLCDPEKINCVLLDYSLPDCNGVEVVDQLISRDGKLSLPIVMLTGHSHVPTAVNVMKKGVRDYLVKGYVPLEDMEKTVLNAIDSAQNEKELSDSLPAADSSWLTLGVLKIHLSERLVFVNEEEMTLTPMEFNLLRAMALRQGRIQSREKLLQDVWKMSSGVKTRTVDMHINQLRQKLKAAGAYIQTIHGVGYRFSI